MSGILGLWNHDGRPVEAEVVARMRQTLAHRSGLECLVVSSTGQRPALVFDGRLDNRDELLAEVAPGRPVDHDPLAARRDAGSAYPDISDADLALAAYLAHGDGFAARLNGDFALALFDPARRWLVLVRDAIGVRPLYYCSTPGAFVFASEIKALLAHPAVRTRPNDDVLADYLFNLLAADDTGGLTFFENVHAVLPAHLVVATGNRVTARRYWDFSATTGPAVTTFDAAVDGFREHFTRAVHRRLRVPETKDQRPETRDHRRETKDEHSHSTIAISVSGGLDSSAIFCTAEQLRRQHGGPSIDGVSYVVPDGAPADEKAYLADIERMYGVQITRWPVRPSGALDGGSQGIRHLEAPMLDARWSGTRAYYQALRARGARTILTGHWGDQVLVEDRFLVDLLRRGAWRTAWRDASEYRRWREYGLDDVRRTLPRALLAELLPAPLLAALRRVDERRHTPALATWYTTAFQQRAQTLRRRAATAPPLPTAHARGIYRQVRSRYHVLSMEWQNKVAAMHGMDAAFPFLDRDLIAYLIALPGELQMHGGVPKVVMREALRDVLPKTIATRRSKADFSVALNTDTARDYDTLLARLATGGRAAAFGYLNPEAVRDSAAFRPAADAETCSLSTALTDLLSLELWLDEFFPPAERVGHA